MSSSYTAYMDGAHPLREERCALIVSFLIRLSSRYYSKPSVASPCKRQAKSRHKLGKDLYQFALIQDCFDLKQTENLH